MTPPSEPFIYRLTVYNQQGDRHIGWFADGYAAAIAYGLVVWLGGKATLEHDTLSNFNKGDTL